jgi:hypothetical protein
VHVVTPDFGSLAFSDMPPLDHFEQRDGDSVHSLGHLRPTPFPLTRAHRLRRARLPPLDHFEQRDGDSIHSLGHPDNQKLVDPPRTLMCNCGHAVEEDQTAYHYHRNRLHVIDSYGKVLGLVCYVCAGEFSSTYCQFSSNSLSEGGIARSVVVLDFIGFDSRMKYKLNTTIVEGHDLAEETTDEHGIERPNLL